MMCTAGRDSLALCFLALFLALFLFLARHAAAAPPVNAASSSAGVSAIERARQALLRGDKQARALLESAYEQQPEPRVLCYLSRAAKLEGKPVESYDLARRCLAEGAGVLDAETEKEAKAAVANPPARSGDVIILSHKGGFLRVEQHLIARVSPGQHVQVTLLPGTYRLKLSADPEPMSVSVQADDVLDVDFDLRQFSVATVVLLLPSTRAGMQSLDSPSVALYFSVLDSPIKRAHSVLKPLEHQRALYQSNPQLTACLSQKRCQIQLGKRAEASYVLGLQIDPAPFTDPGPKTMDYRLSAYLLETHVEKQTAQKEATCTACDDTALLKVVDKLIGDLFDKGWKPVREVEIKSTPGAAIYSDDVLRGKTPARLWFLPGTHAIELRRPYFTSVRENFEVSEDTAGFPQRFERTLQPLPISPGEKATRIAAWITGGVGLAATAVGIGLLLRPDDVVAPTAAANGVVAMPGYLNSTFNPGLGLAVTGGAFLVAAITMAAVDGYRRAQRKAH